MRRIVRHRSTRSGISPPPLRSFLPWALPPTQEAAAATTTEQRERTHKKLGFGELGFED
jgi:hypothetical protein